MIVKYQNDKRFVKVKIEKEKYSPNRVDYYWSEQWLSLVVFTKEMLKYIDLNETTSLV